MDRHGLSVRTLAGMRVEQSHSLLVEVARRPVRAAYIVAASHFTRQTLCSLTHHALSRWGGRYHVIAPCDESAVAPAWLNMLRLVDPDWLFLVGPVSELVVARLHEELYPACLTRVDLDPTVPFQEIPSLLAYAYGVPRWIAGQWLSPEPPRFVTFPAPSSAVPDLFDPAAREFCAINFGLAEDSDLDKTALKGQGQKARSYLRDHFPFFQGLVSDSLGHLITRKDRASAGARMPFTPVGDPNQVVLVVGNTPADMAYAWNLDAFLGWRPEFQTHASTMGTRRVIWLPESFLASEHILDGAIQLAATVPMVPGSDPILDIRSLSSSMATLELVKTRAERAFEQPRVAIGQVLSLTPNAPTFPATTHRGAVNREWTHRATFLERLASIEIPASSLTADPLFIGLSACEFALEQHLDDGIGHTSPPVWTMPQRSFAQHEVLSLNRERSRVTRDGMPTALLSHETRSARLLLPGSRSLIQRILRDCVRVNSDLTLQLGYTHFEKTVRSSQGQHFDAIVDLFGGLGATTSFILQGPWRDIFVQMTGARASEKPMARADRVVRERVFPVIHERTLNEHKKRDLTISIAQELQASQARNIESTISYSRMISAIRSYGAAAFRSQGTAVTGKQLKAWVRGHEWEIEFLVERGVLLQGFRCRCDQCGLTQWMTRQQLAHSLVCAGCHGGVRPSVKGVNWEYKLNELVARAIRERGLIAVLAVLAAQYPWWMPPSIVGTELIPVGHTQAAAEIDIALINNTAMEIGEVKAHPTLFSLEQMRSFYQLGQELRVQRVFFACPRDPEEHWDRLGSICSSLEREFPCPHNPTVSLLPIDLGFLDCSGRT